MLCRGITARLMAVLATSITNATQKNLRFEASDLRGIEKPKAGQLVAFGRKGGRAVIVRPWKPVPASRQGADGGLPAA